MTSKYHYFVSYVYVFSESDDGGYSYGSGMVTTDVPVISGSDIEKVKTAIEAEFEKPTKVSIINYQLVRID